MTRLYTLRENYISVVGNAPAGTDLLEHNGFYFLPLLSGAIIPVTPSQLKSDFVEVYEYPEWLDAAQPSEARVGATLLNGGTIMISIDHLDASVLDVIGMLEVNGVKFVRA